MTVAKMYAGSIASWDLGSVYAIGYGSGRRMPGHGSESAYVDDGCDILPACLTCPLPTCRYDLPTHVAGALVRGARLRLLLNQGMTTMEAAQAMGISRRTVYRLSRSQHIPLPLIERTAP